MSDTAPRRAGQLFGLANTFGSAAGIIGTLAVGPLFEKTGSFNPIFKWRAAMYVFAIIISSCCSPDTPWGSPPQRLLWARLLLNAVI